jgi:hypothetical protein
MIVIIREVLEGDGDDDTYPVGDGVEQAMN